MPFKKIVPYYLSDDERAGIAGEIGDEAFTEGDDAGAFDEAGDFVTQTTEPSPDAFMPVRPYYAPETSDAPPSTTSARAERHPPRVVANRRPSVPDRVVDHWTNGLGEAV